MAASEILFKSAAELAPLLKARKLSPAVTLGRVALVAAGLLTLYFVFSWLLWTTTVSELRGIVQSFSSGAAL